MSDLSNLLDIEPVVATAGTDLLAESIEQQGAEVIRTDWRPPEAGTETALAALAADGRNTKANDTAVARMLAVRPQLVDVSVARDVFPDMTPRTFFHAGPPLTWDRASGPMRGAIIGAMIYEGLADGPEDAEAKAVRGEIELSPCHHHGAVGPMAGVTSPSMPVAVVADGAGDGVAYSTLNEGLGKVLRYGAFAPEAIDRLHWMDAVLGPVLTAVLQSRGPIDLQSLIAQALQMGAQFQHPRTVANCCSSGILRFEQHLERLFIRLGDPGDPLLVGVDHDLVALEMHPVDLRLGFRQPRLGVSLGVADNLVGAGRPFADHLLSSGLRSRERAPDGVYGVVGFLDPRLERRGVRFVGLECGHQAFNDAVNFDRVVALAAHTPESVCLYG